MSMIISIFMYMYIYYMYIDKEELKMKDFFGNDLDIFFTDFSEDILINGVVVEAIVQAPEVGREGMGAYVDCDVVIHVRSRDINITNSQKTININHKLYTINKKKDDMGMTILYLSRKNGV